MPYTDEFMSTPGTYASHGDSLPGSPKKAPQLTLDQTINAIISGEIGFLRGELQRGRVPEHKRLGWKRIARQARDRVRALVKSDQRADLRSRLTQAAAELERALGEWSRRPLQYLTRARKLLEQAVSFAEEHQPSSPKKTKLRVGDLELAHVVVDCPDKTRFRLTWNPTTKRLEVLVLSRGKEQAPQVALFGSGRNSFAFKAG